MNLDVLNSLSTGPLPRASKFIADLTKKGNKSLFGFGKPKVNRTTVKMDLNYPSCVYPGDMDESTAVDIFKSFAKIEKRERKTSAEEISRYPKDKEKKELFRILYEKSEIRLCYISNDKLYMRAYWVVGSYAMVGYYKIAGWKVQEYTLIRIS